MPVLFSMVSQTFQKPISNEDELIQEGGNVLRKKGRKY